MPEKIKSHPLKIERELRGWSQAKVAEEVGTNVRTVIRWEQRQTLPFPYYRERLCALFGKNARELELLPDGDEELDKQETAQGEQPAQRTTEPAASHTEGKTPPVSQPLIGRSREIGEIITLLASADVRLLTLLGLGGIGKTRLSLQLVQDLSPLFADGTYFVTLTAVSHAEQVMSAIAHEFNLTDESVAAQERVQQFLQGKQVLLVLDNFEHVIQAVPALEILLAACPGVKILVTSRVVLHSAMEYQYRLLPLGLPDVRRLSDSKAIAQSPAVVLFVQKAGMIVPGFQVTTANAATLAEICVRLDGVPLAIELAAARVKLLPPHALLPRLSQSLQVLTKGMATLPARQQTLRSTIRWSYDLLDVDEQRLFRLLSVFVGGFTLDGAEAVFATVMEGTTESMTTALDGVDSLIDKSLLQISEAGDEGSEPRISMLETIREFGRERLLEQGEMENARRSHAMWYLSLAEEAAQELQGSQQVKWLERLDAEHGNLQTAMEWMLEPTGTAYTEQDVAYRNIMALRMGGALCLFWIARGYLAEGWKFMEQVLSAYKGDVTSALAAAYVAAAQLIMRLGNLERAEMLGRRGIESYEALGDRAKLAGALRLAGWIAHQRNERTQAYQLYNQSLALFRELNNQQGIASTMLNMAFILQTSGDYAQAAVMLEEVVKRQRALKNKAGLVGALYQLAQVLFGLEEHPPFQRIHAMLREGLELAEELGDSWGAASIRGLSGWIASSEGKLEEARSLVEECLRFYRQGGDREITGQYLTILGEIETDSGDYKTAQSLFEESMTIGQELGDKRETTPLTLEGMARLAIAQGDFPWAVRLLAASARWREELQIPLPPRERSDIERLVDISRLSLGEKIFSAVWDDGRTLSVEDAWSARHRPLPTMPDKEKYSQLVKKKGPKYPAGLSAREVEVLRLVAEGLSDAEVAERLIISTRTVTTHLTSIYNKLDVNSRSAAVRFAVEHHLV